MLITSLENNKIKTYLKLKNKKYRDSYKMFLIEGEHLIKEANNLGLLLDLLVLDGYNFDIDFNYTFVSLDILKKLSSLDNPTKLIGVVKINDSKEIVGNRVLLLDDIQDPGNLGTIIRSSVAFNVTDIILSNNTVDLYNEKVIRGTQGMLFKINIIRNDLIDAIKELKQNNYMILSTNVKNGSDIKTIKPNKFALIMGNEGQGVRKELQDMSDKNIYIKMNNNCESLNVGVATSIILYELNGDL